MDHISPPVAPPDLRAVLDPAHRSPRDIAGAVARLITAGDLAPGQRLPTVRDVAADLGVSPATVSGAWQALRRTGMIVSRGRAGSFVHEESRTSWLSPRYQGLVGDLGDQPLDLSRGTPDPELLPSLEPALSRISLQAGTDVYQESPVLPALEEFLRHDWPTPTPRLTVTNGAMDAIARVLELELRLGDVVALESPGFPPLLDLVESLGAEAVPVGLDREGVRPDDLEWALRRRPRALVLQPRAHNPTGASLTDDRAEALARIVADHPDARDTLVIEDDHSSQISTAPDVSMAALLPSRVVHVRSYSKSLGPDLRLAAVGGPTDLVDRVVARRMLGPGWTSRMVQRLGLDLMTDVASIERVADARRIYAARMAAVRRGLRAQGLEVPKHDGINLWLPVADERAALLHLAAVGIRVAGGSPFVAPGWTGGDHVRVTVGVLTGDHADVAARLVEASRTVG